MRGPEREFLGPKVIQVIEKFEQEAADVDKLLGFQPQEEILPLNSNIVKSLKDLSA